MEVILRINHTSVASEFWNINFEQNGSAAVRPKPSTWTFIALLLPVLPFLSYFWRMVLGGYDRAPYPFIKFFFVFFGGGVVREGWVFKIFAKRKSSEFSLKLEGWYNRGFVLKKRVITYFHTNLPFPVLSFCECLICERV